MKFLAPSVRSLVSEDTSIPGGNIGNLCEKFIADQDIGISGGNIDIFVGNYDLPSEDLNIYIQEDTRVCRGVLCIFDLK